MYVYMYLIYMGSAFCLFGLTFLGVGGHWHWHFFGMNHPTFALLVMAVFLATESLVIFFFVGMGVNVRDYVRDEGADPEFHRRSVALKRVLYPPTLVATLAVMVTFILGGAVDTRVLSRWWHLAAWVLSTWLFLRALRVQHRCMKDNTAIILGILGRLEGQDQSPAAPTS